jgi:site-specific DNA-cytosine methylase
VSGLVLSLFPGIDLLGEAFERAGYCVVRGPDVLFGGDIHRFHARPGVFDGIIGGPPCQAHSTATEMNGTDAVDLIPEFARVVHEARPRWLVMENVVGAEASPGIQLAWHRVNIRDWDCGGLTHRVRRFWSWPFAIEAPPERPGIEAAEWSLMASSWKVRTGIKNGGSTGMHRTMTIEKAQELQGFTLPADSLAKHSKRLAIHMLGNGVPLAMGQWIAAQVYKHTRAAA